MSAPANRTKAKGGIDLIEEAVALLRTAPAAAISAYYIGTAPFILGLLYFWTDMSRSPYARLHLPGTAFAMVLLYVWMKVWQTVFATRVRAHVGGEAPPEFTIRQMMRIALQQAVWQPFSLFVIPVSLIVFLPFGWVCAFYHNLSLTGDGEESSLTDCARKAWSLASLWPGQNHVAISVVSVVWCLVFVNIGAVIAMLPELVKLFTGIESIFTMSGASLMNTTFYAIVAGLTHLCVNPVMKSMYVLRCFYGESLHSGADLRADLNEVNRENRRSRGVAVAAILLLSVLHGPAKEAQAATPAPVVEKAGVPSKDLNESIDRVINKREFQWRVPREKGDVDQERSAIADFIQGIRDWMVRVTKPLLDWWRQLRDWLRRVFNPDRSTDTQGSPALTEDQLTFLLVLLTVAAVILALFLWRVWRRKKETPVVQASPVVVVPDLKDENVVASQLPEEEWQALAAELMSKGELRLAMRALYMASLAFLGSRNLITIARYKSNRDYQRELLRRAREREEMQHAFSENIGLFERSWYGRHEVTPELLQVFDSNHNRIRNVAQ